MFETVYFVLGEIFHESDGEIPVGGVVVSKKDFDAQRKKVERVRVKAMEDWYKKNQKNEVADAVKEEGEDA